MKVPDLKENEIITRQSNGDYFKVYRDIKN